MASSFKAGDEQLRRQSLTNARQLASAGYIDHAVKHYIEARAHLEAARLLQQHGRTWEAIHVLFAVVTLDKDKLATAGPSERGVAVYAAALLQRTGDEHKARLILEGLHPLNAAEQVTFQEEVGSGERERHQRTSGVRAGASARTLSTSPPPPAKRTSGWTRATQKTPFEEAPTPPWGTQLNPPPTADDADTVRPPPPDETNDPPTLEYPVIPPAGRVPRRSPSQGHLEKVRSTIPPAPPRKSVIDGLRKPSAPQIVTEEVVAGRASSAERGALSDDAIDRTLRQLLNAGRKDGAAKVAFAAGKYEMALEWFVEAGLHHGVGACLCALGRNEEAIVHLCLTGRDGPHYREACREIARASIAIGRLDARATEYVADYVESGPRSDKEISAFLDFAELLMADGQPEVAQRCVAAVLRLNPEHDGAQLLKIAWAARR